MVLYSTVIKSQRTQGQTWITDKGIENYNLSGRKKVLRDSENGQRVNSFTNKGYTHIK